MPRSSDTSTPAMDGGRLGGDLADPRAIARRAAEEREEERARLRERQASSLHTPEERIRLWESLHMLSLPRSPAHPLIRLIASETALTLEQVLDEQRRRVSPAMEGR